MATIEVLDDFCAAGMFEGRVFVRGPAGVAAGDLHLTVGDVALPLRPCDEPEPAALPFTRRLLNDPAIPTVPPVEGVGIGVNAIPAWNIEGTDTLHLHFARMTPPVTIRLGPPVPIPANTGPLRFRAQLANHRASATLRLRLAATEAGPERVRVVDFAPTSTGGTAADGYQTVALDVPDSPEPTVLAIEVVYRGPQAGSEEMDPFLFVAGAFLSAASRPWSVPVWLPGRAGAGDRWAEAAFPVASLVPGQDVALVRGGARAVIYRGYAANIRVIEDFGHTLRFQAATPLATTVYIDGQAVAALDVGPAGAAFRMPADRLTGEPMQLELRDSSGSQAYLRTGALPPRLLTPPETLQREGVRHIPPQLFVQSARRYEALRAHLAQPSDEVIPQLSGAIATLEAGYGRARLAPLRFPEVEAPDVSVVIPAHDKVEVTYSCLCALMLARNDVTFEVVLVDDGSTDETSRIEDWVDGITIVRHTEAQRFLRACNAGVARTRGRYVVLLNNDTEPTVGWLDALVDAFERFDNVGLVGSKLVFPNGRLQEAGGIVWGSGNPWNYGSLQNPWDPRFNYARQADYLSAAAMMTTRRIWDELGGFSSYLEPMYFEDTDFAFKVREAGYGTWYVPSSVVFHNEGTTSGTDTGSGFKRFQEVNRPKFKRRWVQAYAGHGREGVEPDLEKDRGILGRVLFIDYATPRPDFDAGSHAALQEIRLVQSLGFKVTFLPEDLAHLGSYTEDLERMGVETIHSPFYLSVAEALERRAHEFDAFYITRFHVAGAVLEQLRRLAPNARVILNNADLHFLRQLRAGIATNDPARVELAAAVRQQELSVMREVDCVLSYSEIEHSVIQSHTDGAVKVMRCPWVVEAPADVPGLAGREGMSFLGSYRHHPNVEAVDWFARAVMPLVETAEPGLTLSLYGSGMDERVRRHASDRIHAAGFVPDVSDAYDRHRIFVAPLVSGAGIKGKVVGALAHGLPCIMTPTAAEGLGLRSGSECFIANTPEEWLEAILALTHDDALWQRMSDQGRACVEQNFSFRRGRELMRAALESVDLFGRLD